MENTLKWKYKGDTFLQKTYTVDFLNKKRIDNDRQVNQYYIEQNHESILDREKWEIVQLEIAKRKKLRDQHKLQFYIMQKENNPFTTKVFCAECGSAFGRKNWTKSWGKRKVWECNNRYRIKGQIGCQNNHIDEEMLETIFLRAIEELKDNKNLLFERWKRLQKEGNLLEQMYGDRLKHLMSQENLEFNGEVMCQVLDHIKLTIDSSITIVFLEETEVTL